MPAKPAPTLKERDVLAFLKTHPAFFAKHAETLATATLPKKTGNILSLHAAKATMAENANAKLETTHQRLLLRAEENTLIVSQIFAASLEIMGCTTLAQLRQTLQSNLPQHLKVEALRFLRVGEADTASTLTAEAIQTLCVEGPVTLRHLAKAEDRTMYGPKGKLVQSDCLLHLSHNGQTLGLLALGSTNPTHFHAGQSTHLAHYLGQVISLCLAKLA
ncbi:MAG: DUF484 family protein [Alphaproteobacteria bacterium]